MVWSKTCDQTCEIRSAITCFQATLSISWIQEPFEDIDLFKPLSTIMRSRTYTEAETGRNPNSVFSEKAKYTVNTWLFRFHEPPSFCLVPVIPFTGLYRSYSFYWLRTVQESLHHSYHTAIFGVCEKTTAQSSEFWPSKGSYYTAYIFQVQQADDEVLTCVFSIAHSRITRKMSLFDRDVRWGSQQLWVSQPIFAGWLQPILC